MRPGDYCKPREEDRCNCDSRGTVPNTQCNPNTLQCQCKVTREGWIGVEEYRSGCGGGGRGRSMQF